MPYLCVILIFFTYRMPLLNIFCTSCIFIKHYFSYNLSILVHRPSLFIQLQQNIQILFSILLLKKFHYVKCFRLMAFPSVSLFPSFSGLSDQTYTHTLRIFILGLSNSRFWSMFWNQAPWV